MYSGTLDIAGLIRLRSNFSDINKEVLKKLKGLLDLWVFFTTGMICTFISFFSHLTNEIGNNFIGGSNMDTGIYESLLLLIIAATGINLNLDCYAQRRSELLIACKKAKEELSYAEEV